MWSRNRYVSLLAIGALDVAIWDIAGKVANMPIHRLLGTCRNSVPAYASSAFLPAPQDYAEEALRYKSLGWTAYKIHPHANPAEDIKICQAVRNAVGSEMILMLDSCWAYGYEEALRVGQAIEDLGFSGTKILYRRMIYMTMLSLSRNWTYLFSPLSTRLEDYIVSPNSFCKELPICYVAT